MESDDFRRVLDAYGGDLSRLEADLAQRRRADNEARRAARSYGKTVLDVRGVSKTYSMGKNRVHAVDNVGFAVREGEMVAITGPSGSGKSTLLNIISGMDRADTGSVKILDREITKLGKNAMAGFRGQAMGFVFQFFYLQPFLDLETNVQIPLMFQEENRSSRPDRLELAREIIGSVGLADRASHLPKELSGGQMQRAAIARALINRPKVVFADEPTGNLDTENTDAIMSLLDSVREREQTAMVIVTHNANVAARADSVIELVDGRIR